MTITRIKPLRENQYSLYVDGEFATKVTDDILFFHKLSEGMDVDAALLNQVVAEARAHFGKERAMYILSYRDHSKAELMRKLQQKTGDPELAQYAADEMEKMGYVDDVRYAQRLAEQLFENKLYGRKRVLQELLQKGIDRETAQDAVDSVETDELENAQMLLERKYSARDLADEKGRRRVINGMLRYGYDFSDIKALLNEYIDEDED